MPVTQEFNASGDEDYTIPSKVYSMRIRIFGASGGGESITNDVYLTSSGGTSGGSSSFLGLTASGGIGGGAFGKNTGGAGGTITVGYNWTSLGATITTANGFKGALNTGGKRATIGSISGTQGGNGTVGEFTYNSTVTHNYFNPPGIHDFASSGSTADISVSFFGGEFGGVPCSLTTAYKHYYIQFTTAFMDTDFVFRDPLGVANWEADYAGTSYKKQAAGGSTAPPFSVLSGLNNNKATEYRVSEYPGTVINQTWRSTTTYGNGAFVIYNGFAYRSKANSNRNFDPENYPDKWTALTVTNRLSYSRVWFCRAGGPTYIANFYFRTIGRKFGAVGRGGGSGAALETTLTREMLVSSGTYAPGTVQTVTVGARGDSGGTGAFNGQSGSVELFMYIIPTVYLTSPSTVDGITAIKLGESVELNWYTEGDADSISWTSGNITNANLTSSATVSPIETTTYTAVASGLGGSSDPASITVIVYQPPTASIVCTTEVDYGDDITLSYSTKYANSSITITPYYKYFTADSTTEVVGDVISITPVATTAELKTDDTLTVVQNNNYTFSPVYNDLGPFEVRFVIRAEGDGGVATADDTTIINIDKTPDNFVVPETEDKFKDEEPVFTPETEILSELLLLDGIDIPVEIKSDYPIKVDINQEGVWRNIREI